MRTRSPDAGSPSAPRLSLALLLLLLLAPPGGAEPIARINPTADSLYARLPLTGAEPEVMPGRNRVCAFELSERVHELLDRQGFAILDQPGNELYEFHSDTYPFVTSDLIFHTFMVMTRAALDELEQRILAPGIGDLAAGFCRASLAQAAALADPALAQLARRNAVLLAVPAVLAGAVEPDDLALPPSWAGLLEEELRRVRRARGVFSSRLLGYEEDYGEYVPRGRHTAGGEIADYSRAVTWLGRTTFRLVSADATRQALLLLDLQEREPALAERWRQLDGLLGLFCGERDDLAFPDYAAVAAALAAEAGGDGPAARAVLDSPELFARFRRLLRDRPPPRVNSHYANQFSPEVWRSLTCGLKILGQRYTRDAHLFQQLMDGQLWPPSGLHVAAALLGSSRAAGILAASDATDWRALVEIPQAAAGTPSGLPEAQLHCCAALLAPPEGAPGFMHGPAWEEKQINTALGAWAEVRHATAPYVKTAHVYMCETEMTRPFCGYVEPYPEFYRRLDELVSRMHAALDSCGLYDAPHGSNPSRASGPPDRVPPRSHRRARAEQRLRRDMLPEFSEILQRLEAMARRELSGRPLRAADGAFLKILGSRLAKLSFNRSGRLVSLEPMSRIVDVAVEYLAGEVLEVGIGRALPIYVAVPDGDRTVVCRGAVYSYHEFLRPVAERLNDTTWQVLAEGPDVPGAPAWLLTRPDLVARCADGRR